MNGLTMIATLHRASQIAEEMFEAEIGPLDITPRQAQVLHSIAQRQGSSQRQVVDVTAVDRSTLADICRRLVRKGWLTRRRTREDARAYALRITPEGARVLKIALAAADRVYRKIDGRLMGAQHLQIVPPVREAAE